MTATTRTPPETHDCTYCGQDTLVQANGNLVTHQAPSGFTCAGSDNKVRYPR